MCVCFDFFAVGRAGTGLCWPAPARARARSDPGEGGCFSLSRVFRILSPRKNQSSIFCSLQYRRFHSWFLPAHAATPKPTARMPGSPQVRSSPIPPPLGGGCGGARPPRGPGARAPAAALPAAHGLPLSLCPSLSLCLPLPLPLPLSLPLPLLLPLFFLPLVPLPLLLNLPMTRWQNSRNGLLI